MVKYDTWEKEKDLENAREVVEKFKERIITEVRRLSQTSFSLYLHRRGRQNTQIVAAPL